MPPHFIAVAACSRQNRALCLAVIWVTVFLVACTPAPRGPQLIGPKVDAVRARHVAYGEALARRDAAAIADFCNRCEIFDIEEDEAGPYVKVSLGNGSLMEDAGSAIEFGYAEVQVSGDLAVSTSECTVTRTSSRTHHAILRRGYCTIIWSRSEDEVWRVRSERRNLYEPLSPSTASAID